MTARQTGQCKWFSNAKHYGFITASSGTDYFVHQSDIKAAGYRTLNAEEAVEFDVVDDEGRVKAANVTGPGGADVIGSKGRSRRRAVNPDGAPVGEEGEAAAQPGGNDGSADATRGARRGGRGGGRRGPRPANSGPEANNGSGEGGEAPRRPRGPRRGGNRGGSKPATAAAAPAAIPAS